MSYIVMIDNGQQWEDNETWPACVCKTQDEAFRAVQLFTNWVTNAQREHDAYMKAWDEKNPQPEWGHDENGDPVESFTDWHNQREQEVLAIGRTVGPPPIWGGPWSAWNLSDIGQHKARFKSVPEWEEPKPRCVECGEIIYGTSNGVCAACLYDQQARNKPLQKHQTCHYCGLSHYKVEAGGIYHCPNRLCPGCGAATTREKMKLKSFKNVEDGRYTLDPEELIHYVANHPHKDPEVHAKEKECVPKWLTREKPSCAT